MKQGSSPVLLDLLSSTRNQPGRRCSVTTPFKILAKVMDAPLARM